MVVVVRVNCIHGEEDDGVGCWNLDLWEMP